MRRKIKDTVFSLYEYCLGGHSTGEYLPSTNLTQNRIPESEQEIVCNSFPNGHGLCGTNMKYGQVYLVSYFITDSYKQDIYMDENIIFVL